MSLGDNRLLGGAVMVVLSLLAIYSAYTGFLDLLSFFAAITARTPVATFYSSNVGVIPGVVMILLFTFLEIARPGDPWRKRLGVLVLACFAAVVILPIVARLVLSEMLPERGYAQCPGRVVGATLPASRWALDPTLCRARTS